MARKPTAKSAPIPKPRSDFNELNFIDGMGRALRRAYAVSWLLLNASDTEEISDAAAVILDLVEHAQERMSDWAEKSWRPRSAAESAAKASEARVAIPTLSARDRATIRRIAARALPLKAKPKAKRTEGRRQ